MVSQSAPPKGNRRERRDFIIDLIVAGTLVVIPLFVVVFCLLWASGIVGDASLAGRLTSIGGDAFGIGVIVTFRKVATERLTRQHGGKATVHLEFRAVGPGHPSEGIKIDHSTIDLDDKECKYEIHSGDETVCSGGVTVVSALDTGAQWSVITPTPSAQGDTLLLTLKERNTGRIWKTRPFHIETLPIVARSRQ